jgi:protein SCO1/2
MQIGGDFELMNQDGQRVRSKDWKGKYLLIYFGYSFCPDICPMGLRLLSKTVQQLPVSVASQVQPLFVTLDPQRDTPAVLKSFLESFDGSIQGLTGTEAEIEKVLARYKVYARRSEDNSQFHQEHPEYYMMDHTSLIYLMDLERRYVGHVDHQASVEALVALIRQHIPVAGDE